MENEGRYNLEEAQSEASVLQEKADMLFSEKNSYSIEEYSEAEKHVEEMLNQYGTLETVANALEFEKLLRELDLEDEFANAQVQTEQILEQNMDRIREELSNYGKKLITENPQISQEEIASVLMIYSQQLQEKITLQQICESPKAKLLSGDDRFLNLIILYQNILTASGEPDGNPPSKDGSNFHEKERLKKPTPQILMTTTGSPSPPPPEGDDEPKKYSEMEPDNLVSMEWRNGDRLLTEPAFKWTDKDGRERQFYYLKLVYTPKGKSEKAVIDLSRYIEGKTIAFEGVKNSYFGAALEPEEREEYEKVRGRSFDTGDHTKKFPYIVGLNVAMLQQDELMLATVFHEIGHVALYGSDEESISEEKRNVLSSLFNPKKEEVKIKQIEKYQEAHQRLLNVVKETLPKLSAKLVEVDLELSKRPIIAKREPS